MSFEECIVNAEAEGTITKDQAARAKDLFGDLQEQYTATLGPQSAAAKAAKDAFDALEIEAMERRRRKLLQAAAWRKINVNLSQYRDIRGQENYAKAALALFEQDGLSKYSSLVQREQVVERAATRQLYQVLATFRRNIVGETRNKAQLKNMVREVFGENTGDVAAKEMAQAWSKASDYLRKRFNAAGGRIPARQDWGMPQVHNMLAVRQATPQEWKEFIRPLLDMKKMVDEQTGLPFNPEKLELALTNVYENIATDGLNKLIPGSPGQGRSMANRRLDHRFLVFKDADSWMKYQERFGNDNAFDVMFSHIKAMSKDIASMEILGPNPTSTINFLKQTVTKQLGAEKGNEAAASMDTLYLAITGAQNAPVNAKFATTLAGTRQLLQAAQLGRAAISALTDINFGRLARQFTGLPQTKMLQNYLKLMMPLGLEERGKLAIRLGLVADGWSTLAAAQMRYVGEISGPEITRRIADGVMRASLLSPMTSAGRWAFGMEFLGNLADNVGKRFDELEPAMQKTFERYGLKADHWDIMRRTELYNQDGATFLRAEDIEARTDISPRLARDLGTRLMEMVETETNFAVPSTSLRGRAALIGASRPGTISGELARSFAMYKAFGVTLVNTHLARGMQIPGVKGKGRYFADLLISTTLMGALALQLKEMSKGRDPRPMTSAEFWGAAFLQGGGLGIYGDFLFSDANRFDRGLPETVAGPVVGFFNDLRKLTVGNLFELATGEDTNFAKEFTQFTSRYLPGKSIWYMDLALQRMVFDQLELMADPKAPQNMRRMESRYRNEFGQEYWWAPGDITPQRDVDLGNMVAPAP